MTLLAAGVQLVEQNGLAPTGTVTVVLGDVARSTRMWQDDPRNMAVASARITELTRELAEHHGGHLPREQGEGDNFVAAFPVASDATSFAIALDEALAGEPWPGDLVVGMRVGIHTGDVTWDDASGYLGPTFNRCARIRDLGHARMILLSQATRDIVSDGLPATHDLIDLGQHQLRDLSRAEQVFHLLAKDDDTQWPPLKSVSALPNNLPVPVTSLVGRREEIQSVGKLLLDNRLVTLTGSGGSGKTRLAQHVASEVLQFATDGAWWVDLMPVTEDDQVVTAIAATVGATEVTTEHQLVAELRESRLLLIIDNCEHLIDRVADVVDVLLRDTRHLKILATSRETIGIEGEQNFRVRPLAEVEAAELFAERAAAVAQFLPSADDNEAIGEICRRLDGIPLAIELAAARTRLLSPRDIANGLDDRFRLLTSGARRARSRQRTLEASVAWSFDLLDDEERLVLSRLGVLPTAFDLETAQAVGTLESPTPVFLDVLTSLVEKSLIAVRPDDHGRRYGLLETIKQYAIDRLTEAGQAEDARDAHLRHVISRMEEAERRTLSEPRFNAPRHLKLWADDIRAAQAWAVATSQTDAVIDLHWPNYWSAVLLSDHRDALAALTPLLDDAQLDGGARARVIAMVATFKVAMSDYAGAAVLVEEGLAEAREADDLKVLLGTLVSAAVSLGMHRGKGIEFALEAVELARPLGPVLFATAGYALGLCLEWSDVRVADHEHLLVEAHEAAHRSGIPQLIVGMDGILYGHWAAQGRLIETYDKMARTRDYAIEHAPRVLATWAILPGLWTWHWTDEHDETINLVETAMSLAGPSGSLSHTMALLARATGYYTAGRSPELVLDDTEAAVARLRGSGARHWLTIALSLRAAQLHGLGAHDEARRLVAEARELLPPAGWNYARGTIPWAEGLDPEVDPEQLIAGAVDTLEQVAGMGWFIGWPLPMLLLGARSHHRMGNTDLALTLLGVVEQTFTLIEVPAGKPSVDYIPGWNAEVREEVLHGLAQERIEAGLAKGRGIAWQDAIDLMRLGPSPASHRPVSGWGALTPAEVDVATKVAEGLTNPEVAGALFVSTNTVKTHLKNIYAKLDISSRAALATTVAEQS